MTVREIRAVLQAHADETYRRFQSRLLPTVEESRIIGVRMPELRRLACQISDATAFLAELPHRYYEEDLLHGLLIAQMTDFSQCIAALDCFLPYVDNWAVCDLPPARVLSRTETLDALQSRIRVWLASEHPYTVLYAIELLMRFYLTEPYLADSLQTVSEIVSDEYYVHTAIAWFFATALAVDEAKAEVYFARGCLQDRVRRMAIRKALESFRVSAACKAWLRGSACPAALASV